MVTTADTAALAALRRRWWGLLLAWSVVVLLLFLALWQTWNPRRALQWLLIGGGLAAYVLFFLRRHLRDNRREAGAPLLPRLGPGNALSLHRGLAMAVVGGFLFAPRPDGFLAWLPAIVYTFADIADYFDGYLARRANHATRLGEQLDIEFDGLGMLLVTLLAVGYGQLPLWYLTLGLARYLFLLGIWWRKRQGKPIYELSPSEHRRVFAGMQMGFMSVVLWPILPAGALTIAGTLFAIPTALGFLRDWLVISGRLDPQNERYRAVQRWLVTASRVYAPPLLRLVIAGGMGLVYAAAWPRLWQPETWQALFAGWGVPGATAIATFLAVLGIATAAAVTVGWLGRAASLFLLFPLGFDIVANGLAWYSGAALAADIAILLLGTGPLSLWRPEERYLFVRAGDEGFGEER